MTSSIAKWFRWIWFVEMGALLVVHLAGEADTAMPWMRVVMVATGAVVLGACAYDLLRDDRRWWFGWACAAGAVWCVGWLAMRLIP